MFYNNQHCCEACKQAMLPEACTMKDVQDLLFPEGMHMLLHLKAASSCPTRQRARSP